MNEPRWYDSTEELRTIQSLVRASQHQEALDRAGAMLLSGRLSRRQAARLHSLICWVYTEEMHKVTTVAVLHGEEAVRLAALVGDAWTQCEALTRLIHAYCRMGDAKRARSALEGIAAEVAKNEGVLSGGTAALHLLRATVAAAEGDEEEHLQALEAAEGAVESLTPEGRQRVRWLRVEWLLERGRHQEARRLMESSMEAEEGGPSNQLEWETAKAWLALVENPAHSAEARQLARQALHRSFAAGRLDLARRLRRRAGHLL